MNETCHIPVLMKEVCDALRFEEGGDYLDCTLGGGGHTEALLKASEKTHIVGIDRDARAISRTQERLASYGDRLDIAKGSFSKIQSIVGDKKFDGVLADLGISSDQLAEGRGFSFNDESELDMRMDEDSSLSAYEIVNTYSPSDLIRVLRNGGVGTDARRIALAIIRERPVEDTKSLSDIVSKTASHKEQQKKRHPATITFQAIRIAVNSEKKEIEALLDIIPNIVKPKARVAVISFHSMEDKLVASKMRKWAGADAAPPSWGIPTETRGVLLTRKATKAGEEEIAENFRSRSALLRVFEFN